MNMHMLVQERAVAFGVLQCGGISGDTYNGTAIADTVDTPMVADVGSSGKGIDCSNYYRAFVVASLGAVAATGSIKAYTAKLGYAADDADAELTEVPGWEIPYTASDDNKVLVGEIGLQRVAGQALWIRHNGTSQLVSITVTLEDPQLEIASGRNTLIANYPQINA